jgi:hypothetical protein
MAKGGKAVVETVDPIASTRVAKKKFGGPQEGAGRPLLPITEDEVYKLALIHCTEKEIASVLGCSTDTVRERFSAALHKGWENGQMSLKRKMHTVAMEGDTKMLIWISKQRLGYKDSMPEEATIINFNVNIVEIPK